MATYNTLPHEPDNTFRILGAQRPEEAEDRDSLRIGQLESYAATPTYEP